MVEASGVPPNHPRAESLRIREKLIEHHKTNAVAIAGLLAHGRGEAFDYLIGEETGEHALKAIRAAVAAMLLAKKPVISVNGNAAALVAEDIVELADATGARIEVNLFHRSLERELAIAKVLRDAGAQEILGVGKCASSRIDEICSERRRVDPRGILVADVVLVPLEDGDRTEALGKMGKTVIAIDLNPLSRTAQKASITIVDNIVRALPLLVKEAYALRILSRGTLLEILSSINNRELLAQAVRLINRRLSEFARKSLLIPEEIEVYQQWREKR